MANIGAPQRWMSGESVRISTVDGDIMIPYYSRAEPRITSIRKTIKKIDERQNKEKWDKRKKAFSALMHKIKEKLKE